MSEFSSTCPTCEGEGEVIKEPYESFGVTVEAAFRKCSKCGTTWMSGRQEHELDMARLKALAADRDRLQKDLDEEYRINGMGQERELKLMTQLKEAKSELRLLRTSIEYTEFLERTDKLGAEQARIKELEAQKESAFQVTNELMEKDRKRIAKLEAELAEAKEMLQESVAAHMRAEDRQDELEAVLKEIAEAECSYCRCPSTAREALKEER
jgi:hypothetical protein